jgi:hypothetical protein
VSPWVTFKTTSQSMKRNVYGDYVDHDSIRRAAGLFADGMEDTYCAPLTATATSWKGIKVRHLAIVAGEFEIMVDDIIQFAENVKVINRQPIAGRPANGLLEIQPRCPVPRCGKGNPCPDGRQSVTEITSSGVRSVF